ncbi:MAG: DUF1015 domain-containing protein [Pirellulaceae bacterium]
MAQIEAFRGIRYDLGHVGSLSDVVAPPYDVIDPDFQSELYKRHPANVIRLILNREEPGDDEQQNRYSRAARFLRNWLQEGVLQRDKDPALYVYHQEFEFEGQRFTRRGFMCRTRLERFGEGRIYPHEETHASAKADRLRLTQACRTNLSQIFGIYPDDQNRVQSLMEADLGGQTPLEATDHLGVVHRLWLVTDVKRIAEVTAAMAEKPIFIADGHHRYETACNYRDGLTAHGPLPANHPANFVLMMCISMNDPGLIVFPTHRLFRGLPRLTAAQLVAKLGDCFVTESAGQGPQAAVSIWSGITEQDDQGQLAFYTQPDQQWTLARLTPAGQNRLEHVAADHTAEWRSLGVSILHRLVVETLLGARQLPKAHYVHRVEEVVDGLSRGDPDGGEFPLAALVMPARVADVKAISEHWERMPAKSTYFYPKLLSGLVLHSLEPGST